jgi:hypothetical protein
VIQFLELEEEEPIRRQCRVAGLARSTAVEAADPSLPVGLERTDVGRPPPWIPSCADLRAARVGFHRETARAAARSPNGERMCRRGDPRRRRLACHPPSLSLHSSGCASAGCSIRSIVAQRECEGERVKKYRVPPTGVGFVHRERRATVKS